MSKRTQNHYGIGLALLGLAVAGVELGRYWLLDVKIGPIPMVTACVLFFVGGAIIDVQKATQIGNAVVSGAVTIIGALPFGRRTTDKIANAGGTVVIPPTDEHPVPSVPPKRDAAPVAVPSETEIFPDGRGPNDQVGGIL